MAEKTKETKGQTEKETYGTETETSEKEACSVVSGISEPRGGCSPGL